jgi:hypothetical protein
VDSGGAGVAGCAHDEGGNGAGSGGEEVEELAEHLLPEVFEREGRAMEELRDMVAADGHDRDDISHRERLKTPVNHASQLRRGQALASEQSNHLHSQLLERRLPVIYTRRPQYGAQRSTQPLHAAARELVDAVQTS